MSIPAWRVSTQPHRVVAPRPLSLSMDTTRLSVLVVDDEPALREVLSLRIADLLMPGGVALFEIGFDQGESAANLFRGAFLDVELRRDLAGNARCLIVTGP